MLRHFLRACLIITLLAVGLSFVEKTQADMSANYPIILVVGMAFLAGVVIVIDILIPRKSLQALVAIFVGLGVGLLISFGITVVIDSLTTAFFPVRSERFSDTITVLKVLLGVISCYYCISFVLQTKDDIRFVIPYVEFSKQVKGNRPLILDTSVIIDGRIVEICDTGFIEQTLVVPRFVLHELQAVADSNDKLKRVRGRRGLDVLNALQSKENVDVEILEPKLSPAEATETVDLKLLALAQQINGRVATNDYNLNKIGQLRGVEILNINDLTNALKPIALPGETMIVKIVKPGEESDQGVGYLDDGTMVVVEQGRNHIGETVTIGVTSMLQTSAGRMIFGRIEAQRTADIRRRASNQKRVESASKK